MVGPSYRSSETVSVPYKSMTENCKVSGKSGRLGEYGIRQVPIITNLKPIPAGLTGSVEMVNNHIMRSEPSVSPIFCCEPRRAWCQCTWSRLPLGASYSTKAKQAEESSCILILQRGTPAVWWQTQGYDYWLLHILFQLRGKVFLKEWDAEKLDCAAEARGYFTTSNQLHLPFCSNILGSQ